MLNNISKFSMKVFSDNSVQLQDVITSLKDEVEQLLMLLSERERFVIERRFALDITERATLEEIGQHYNVTRERIRQIENNALQKLKRNINNSVLSDINNAALDHINAHGGIIKEEVLLSLLLKEKSGFHISAFLFTLSLDNRFTRKTNTISYLPHFRLDTFSDKTMDDVSKDALSILKIKKDVVEIDKLKDELVSVNEQFDFISNEGLKSLFAVHKSFKLLSGSVGLITWKHIHPRTLRDKIFFVLRESTKPMHFVDIANSIIEKKFDTKNVNLQAVHNELIRYQDFILIGRGLYALKEWGYKPGTVADVIESILKKTDHMTEDEIINEVLKSRKVKKITIILNLKNNPKFSRVGRKKYKLKK